MKKFRQALFVTIGIALLAPSAVLAAKGDQGVDWAIYQGETGRFGYDNDKFAIAQIGGYNESGIYDQWTYKSQVASAIAQGKRAHTYIWYDTWGDMNIAKTTMDYFLPKIQTPKGSIIALDFESGASSNVTANTDTILYGMRRIKEAGYTPMYYSYKPFTLQYVDYKRIIKEFPNSLWMAAYPDYNVTPSPNYSVFPSMEDVAIYQFTSTYIPGGLDGNVDLTGITDKGYTKSDQPKTDTPATDAGKEAEKTPTKDIKEGDKVKVKFDATNWATGEGIADFVKGNTYTVAQVSNDKTKYLLAGVNSWIIRSDIEVLSTTKTEEKLNETTDSGWIEETGTFTADTTIKIRNGASTSSQYTGVNYYFGETVSYNAYEIDSNGYVWIRYTAWDGSTHYMATGEAQNGHRVSYWGIFY